MKFNTLILAILMLSGVVLPMMPEVHPQIPRNEGDEPLEFKSSPTTGNNATNWQSDTTFTTDEIKVAENVGGGFNINIGQGTWWYGQKLENTTWISMRQTDWLTGDYVYLECKNNDNNQIKCWLRGTVTGEYNFWIELTGGTWNEDTFRYETPEFSMDYTDVYEFGFPMIWDEENSRLGIKVSGTFDIDPLISPQLIPDAMFNLNNAKETVVHVGHFEYIFFSQSNYLRYIYRNTTTVANGDTSWINSTKAWAVNRTYSGSNYNYVQNDVNEGRPIAFDTNGTHIYGFTNSLNGKCGRGQTLGKIGCFLLFNVTQPGDKNNITDGYNAGHLVVHTNASIPCLGNGDDSGNSTHASSGSNNCGNSMEEIGECSTTKRCGFTVKMNSTGFPMMAWTTHRSQGANPGPASPAIMIAVAENPVGATCFDSTAGVNYTCTENDARNGAEGTWTKIPQVGKSAGSGILMGANSTHSAGSGARYIWSVRETMGTQIGLNVAHGQENWNLDMCSMGSGNMLLVKHNTTATGDDDGKLWGRFWYQGNASWGSSFNILDAGPLLDAQDNMDLTCTPNSAGVMTAHLMWTKQDANDGKPNKQPTVYYRNFTSAAIAPDTDTQVIADWSTPNNECDCDIQMVDARIVADNSTGLIGIYYLDLEGNLYFNTTGTFGTQGFIDDGMLYYNVTSKGGLRDNDLLSMPDYFNGTGIERQVRMIVGTSQNNTYVEYYNSSIRQEVKFLFYGQAGMAMPVDNMTFYSYRNGSSLTSSSDCSTCTVLLQPGWYRMDKIYRNNANTDLNISSSIVPETSFYVGRGYNSSVGFIVGNITISINFYRELLDDGGNATPWPDPNCGGNCPSEYTPGDTDNKFNIEASMWFGNQKVEKVFDSFGTRTDQTAVDKRTFFVDSEPTKIQFRYDNQDSDNAFNASRWVIPDVKCATNQGCTIPLTIYLSDFRTNRCGASSGECPHYVYVFNLLDPTVNTFVGGTFVVKKQTVGGIIQISEQPIPASFQVETTLHYREEYLLSVISEDRSVENSIGAFLAEDDVSTTLIIEDISFTPEIIVQHKYLRWDADHNRTAGTVDLWFRDVNNQTDSVNIIIWNMSGIQYNSTQTAQSFSITWPGASSNSTQTYWAKIVVNHAKFGEIIESKAVKTHGSPGNFIDFGRCPTCTDRLLEMDSPWFVYISGFATIFVAGLFSTASAVAGTLILAAWVGIMYQFGFFPGMESIMMAMIMLFAIITVFAISRRDF